MRFLHAHSVVIVILLRCRILSPSTVRSGARCCRMCKLVLTAVDRDCGRASSVEGDEDGVR